MNTLNERIKKLRRFLDFTQQEFAEKIGTARNNIAGYETGKRSPSEAVISLICKTFNVNETWLRTGEGGMFVERTRDDELAAFMDELLVEESVNFRQRLVTALSRLKPEQWEALEALALELTKGPISQTSDPPVVQTDEDIEAQVAEYRRQLLAEKEQAEKSSVSQNDPGNGNKKMA